MNGMRRSATSRRTRLGDAEAVGEIRDVHEVRQLIPRYQLVCDGLIRLVIGAYALCARFS